MIPGVNSSRQHCKHIVTASNRAEGRGIRRVPIGEGVPDVQQMVYFLGVGVLGNGNPCVLA